MRSHAMCLALFLCSVGTSLAADGTVLRYVELRDGSVLRLPVVDASWKVSLIQKEGKFLQTSYRLSELEAVRLVPERIFDKKKALLNTVIKLGSDDAEERGKAQQELVEMGSAVRGDLELFKELFTDPEIETRLANILEKLPGRNKALDMPFDLFGGKETIWGDCSDAAITVQVQGKQVRLLRKDYRGFSIQPPDKVLYAKGIAGFRQLGPKDYPPACTEEGFETAPDDRKLTVGENVEKVFVKKGFTLSTSIKTSYVSVNSFEVRGKTRGLSCATQEPLWHGEITITFCQPGHERVPAGVHYFGTWIAYVEVNGTALHAYDIQGREVGKVAVRKREHDFLGFYSPVPIHKVRVVPNLRIDPDYTLDDFIFTEPRAFEPAHADRCLVKFAGGEQALCSDVEFGRREVIVQGLAAGLPAVTRPYAEVLRVLPPDRAEPAKSSAGIFVELQDGSVLFGSKPQDEKAGPVFRRKAKVLSEPESIVGMWGSNRTRPTWPDKAPEVGVQDQRKGIIWRNASGVKLGGARWSYQGLDPKGEAVERPYDESAVVFMKTRTNPQVVKWRLRTVQGEELVLDSMEGLVLSGHLRGELKAKWDGREIKLNSDEIAAIVKE